MSRLTHALVALSLSAAAAAAQPTSRAARPPRLSVELSALGTRLPAALRDLDACGRSADAGVGLAVGAGYRLFTGLRAEARLGAFGQPGAGNADCVSGPISGLRLPPPPGTVERTTGFDPFLADRRAFTQGRLVADVPARTQVLRLSAGAGTLLRIRAPFASAGAGFGGRVRGTLLMLEAERWWMRAPTLDRTTTWEALPVPAGAPAGYVPTQPVVTAERRGSRSVRATWLRVSATLPVPGA